MPADRPVMGRRSGIRRDEKGMDTMDLKQVKYEVKDGNVFRVK